MSDVPRRLYARPRGGLHHARVPATWRSRRHAWARRRWWCTGRG